MLSGYKSEKKLEGHPSYLQKLLVERLLISPKDVRLFKDGPYRCYFKQQGGATDHNMKTPPVEGADPFKHPAFKGFQTETRS